MLNNFTQKTSTASLNAGNVGFSGIENQTVKRIINELSGSVTGTIKDGFLDIGSPIVQETTVETFGGTNKRILIIDSGEDNFLINVPPNNYQEIQVKTYNFRKTGEHTIVNYSMVNEENTSIAIPLSLSTQTTMFVRLDRGNNKAYIKDYKVILDNYNQNIDMTNRIGTKENNKTKILAYEVSDNTDGHISFTTPTVSGSPVSLLIGNNVDGNTILINVYENGSVKISQRYRTSESVTNFSVKHLVVNEKTKLEITTSNTSTLLNPKPVLLKILSEELVLNLKVFYTNIDTFVNDVTIENHEKDYIKDVVQYFTTIRDTIFDFSSPNDFSIYKERYTLGNNYPNILNNQIGFTSRPVTTSVVRNTVVISGISTNFSSGNGYIINLEDGNGLVGGIYLNKLPSGEVVTILRNNTVWSIPTILTGLMGIPFSNTNLTNMKNVANIFNDTIISKIQLIVDASNAPRRTGENGHLKIDDVNLLTEPTNSKRMVNANSITNYRKKSEPVNVPPLIDEYPWDSSFKNKGIGWRIGSKVDSLYDSITEETVAQNNRPDTIVRSPFDFLTLSNQSLKDEVVTNLRFHRRMLSKNSDGTYNHIYYPGKNGTSNEIPFTTVGNSLNPNGLPIPRTVADNFLMQTSSVTNPIVGTIINDYETREFRGDGSRSDYIFFVTEHDGESRLLPKEVPNLSMSFANPFFRLLNIRGQIITGENTDVRKSDYIKAQMIGLYEPLGDIKEAGFLTKTSIKVVTRSGSLLYGIVKAIPHSLPSSTVAGQGAGYRDTKNITSFKFKKTGFLTGFGVSDEQKSHYGTLDVVNGTPIQIPVSVSEHKAMNFISSDYNLYNSVIDDSDIILYKDGSGTTSYKLVKNSKTIEEVIVDGSYDLSQTHRPTYAARLSNLEFVTSVTSQFNGTHYVNIPLIDFQQITSETIVAKQYRLSNSHVNKLGSLLINNGNYVLTYVSEQIRSMNGTQNLTSIIKVVIPITTTVNNVTSRTQSGLIKSIVFRMDNSYTTNNTTAKKLLPPSMAMARGKNVICYYDRNNPSPIVFSHLGTMVTLDDSSPTTNVMHNIPLVGDTTPFKYSLYFSDKGLIVVDVWLGDVGEFIAIDHLGYVHYQSVVSTGVNDYRIGTRLKNGSMIRVGYIKNAINFLKDYEGNNLLMPIVETEDGTQYSLSGNFTGVKQKGAGNTASYRDETTVNRTEVFRDAETFQPLNLKDSNGVDTQFINAVDSIFM